MKKIDYITYRSNTSNISKKIHFHTDSYEIWHIIHGSGIFLINGIPYSIRDNMVIIIFPSEMHCAQLNSNPDPIISRFSADAIFLSKILDTFEITEQFASAFGKKDNGGVFYLKSETNQKINDLFEKISKLWTSEAIFDNAKIWLAIIQILILSIESQKANIKSDFITDIPISRILSSINFNLGDQNLSLDILSQKLYISKYRICHIFKEKMNMTFMEYLINQRIAHAKLLLVSSDKKCIEIAELCGFSSFSFFSRKFREVEGITPNQYRKSKKHQILVR